MSKPYVVGIDIGGTNTVFGIVDARGTVLASSSIKTRKHADINDYISELHVELSKLIETNEAEGKIAGIGIGAPNANYFTGMISDGVNLPWPTPIPLADLISEKFGLPVAITNDANAASIGEMTYGAARGMKDFIMITLGTGVGSGIVVNGQMVYGHDGFAGELGHVIMKRHNGRLCGCGRTGCLEAYASATGVARTAREFLDARTGEQSLLRNIDIDSITSKDVFDAAVAGDKLAKDVFEFTGEILGEALADFISFSSPEAIILFGGLTKSGDLLMKPVKEAMDKNTMAVFRGKVKLLISELKESVLHRSFGFLRVGPLAGFGDIVPVFHRSPKGFLDVCRWESILDGTEPDGRMGKKIDMRMIVLTEQWEKARKPLKILGKTGVMR